MSVGAPQQPRWWLSFETKVRNNKTCVPSFPEGFKPSLEFEYLSKIWPRAQCNKKIFKHGEDQDARREEGELKGSESKGLAVRLVLPVEKPDQEDQMWVQATKFHDPGLLQKLYHMCYSKQTLNAYSSTYSEITPLDAFETWDLRWIWYPRETKNELPCWRDRSWNSVLLKPFPSCQDPGKKIYGPGGGIGRNLSDLCPLESYLKRDVCSTYTLFCGKK